MENNKTLLRIQEEVKRLRPFQAIERTSSLNPVNIIRQRTDKDCGVCCVAMLCDVSYEEAAEILRYIYGADERDPTTTGIGYIQIYNACLSLGVEAIMGYSTSIPIYDVGPFGRDRRDRFDPQTDDGIYGLDLYGYPFTEEGVHHFALALRGHIYDPHDGKITLWRDYQIEHNAKATYFVTRSDWIIYPKVA